MVERDAWQALRLAEVVELFDGTAIDWWVRGGMALELHLGRSWRMHHDADVAVVRRDVGALRRRLAGWDVHLVTRSADEPAGRWDGGSIAAERNLWCRRHVAAPWCLDVVVVETGDPVHTFAFEGTIDLPRSSALLIDERGVTYLAPEVQLLAKSRFLRAQDEVDAREVIPLLEPERRAWLTDRLPAAHPWRVLLAGSGPG